MARIRTVKPEFFKHEALFEAELSCGLPLRLAYVGLWCCADKSGRFKWRPRQLKLDCLPYDDIDFSRVLDALFTRGFIVRYRVGNDEFGCIPSFSKHQVINNREKASELPDLEHGEVVDTLSGAASSTRAARVDYASSTPLGNPSGERKGREGKGKEGEGNGYSTEPAQSLALVQAEITLPMNTGDEFPVTSDQVAEFSKLYPAVDVIQSLKAMRGWLISNPSKRKTKTGILRFVNSWLAKEQDRGGNRTISRTNFSNRQQVVEDANDEVVRQIEAQVAAECGAPVDDDVIDLPQGEYSYGTC